MWVTDPVSREPCFEPLILRGALVGETLEFTDLLIPAGSHQVAQVPDFDAPAIVVRSGDSTSIELLYINDPLGDSICGHQGGFGS